MAGSQEADVVCLQELKAQEKDLSPDMFAPIRAGAHSTAIPLRGKKGYSGVGIWSRQAPDQVTVGSAIRASTRKAATPADFGQLSVISSTYLRLQLPGTAGSQIPLSGRILPVLAALKAEGREVVLCGDWNIAHQEIDLKNGNPTRKPGFLPEERAWLTRSWMNRLGGRVPPPAPGHHGRGLHLVVQPGQAWAKNVGWRIDYQSPPRPGREGLTNEHLQRAAV
jgi:exodeoxyribonuclease-3